MSHLYLGLLLLGDPIMVALLSVHVRRLPCELRADGNSLFPSAGIASAEVI